MDLKIKLSVAQDRKCVTPTSRDVLLFVGLDTPVTGTRNINVPVFKNIDLAVALDCSGSMTDPEDRAVAGSPSKLASATRALWQLIERLRDDDMISVIAFDNRTAAAIEPVSGAACKARFQDPAERAAIEDYLKKFGQMTNVLEALRLARSKLPGRPGAISRIILLSDGIANLPQLGSEQAIQAATKRYAEEVGAAQIPIYVLGYGQGTDVYPTFLQDLCQGGGEWEHVRGEPQTVFNKVFAGAQTSYAANVLLKITFPNQVQVGNAYRYEPQIKHLGPVPVTATSRTVTIPAGQLEAGKHYTWIFEVNAPATEVGVTQVADVELSYLLPNGTRDTDHQVVTVEVTDSRERAQERNGNYMIYYQDAVLSKYDEALEAARKANNRAEIERLLTIMVKQSTDAGLMEKASNYQDQLNEFRKSGDMTMTILKVAGKTSVPQQSLQAQLKEAPESHVPPTPIVRQATRVSRR